MEIYLTNPHLKVLKMDIIGVSIVHPPSKKWDENMEKFGQQYHGWKEAQSISEDCHEGRVVLCSLKRFRAVYPICELANLDHAKAFRLIEASGHPTDNVLANAEGLDSDLGVQTGRAENYDEGHILFQ